MKLAIYCAGGAGKEVYDLALRNNDGRFGEFFFVDDMRQEGRYYGSQVKKFSEVVNDGDTEFVIANGEPFIREELYEKIKAGGFRLAKLIDRTATISRSAMISEGNIISSGCFVSSDAILGKNVYMQSSSVIAHDATVGDNSVISSFCQVSGSCKISNNVYVGIGSMIREKIKIDTGSIIGMGSFVQRDVGPFFIAMGNPARVIARNESRRVFAQDNAKSYAKKNVLILSAGRRVELVRAFKKAQVDLGMQNAKVVAADMSLLSPALYVADKYLLLPKCTDANYIDELISAMLNEGTDLVVPTIDTELLVLAENKEKIEEATGAKIMISNVGVVKTCCDKKSTMQFFEKNGFPYPKTYSPAMLKQKELKFPLFLKPRSGSSSINTFKAENARELDFFLNFVPDPIVQEFVDAKEYTVDIFTDFDNRLISIVPRIRLATRGGEILKGKIDKNPALIAEIKRLISALKPTGHITVQCFYSEEDGIKYIEINPRYGGGAPMSFYAGAHSPTYALKSLCGEKLKYEEDYTDKLVFLRFDDCIMVKDNDNKA